MAFECSFQSLSYKSFANIPQKGGAQAPWAPPLNPPLVQYKVTHGYFPTNVHLNKIKIKDTNLCKLCAEVDTLDHFFIECQETIGLWQRFFDLFTPILNNSQLTNSQILYVILQTDKNALALNWVILIMKHYIYTHKWKKIAVSIAEFLEHLKYQTKIEKESEKMYSKSLSFKWKWQIVENFLTLWLLK